MPSTHTYGYTAIQRVGITLFVSTQGCGRPQLADEQMVDTHVFRCVVKTNEFESPKLGCHKGIKTNTIWKYELQDGP